MLTHVRERLSKNIEQAVALDLAPIEATLIL